MRSVPHAYPLAELVQFFKFLKGSAENELGLSARKGNDNAVKLSFANFKEQRKVFWLAKGDHT